jgi:hypothetical protein
MHLECRPRRFLVSLALAVACAAAMTQASPALADTPAPTVCNGPAPSAFCYYEVGIVPFTLSSHFVHVGHILTGTAHWTLPGQGHGEFPTNAFVQLGTSGPGLKLLGCHGPTHANNNKSAYGGPNAFKLVTGSTTCRWRAMFATGWSTSLGASLAITGSNPYYSADYYQVTGKTALEGTIRIKNDRKDAQFDLGVVGAKVHVTGRRAASTTPPSTATATGTSCSTGAARSPSTRSSRRSTSVARGRTP